MLPPGEYKQRVGLRRVDLPQRFCLLVLGIMKSYTQYKNFKNEINIYKKPKNEKLFKKHTRIGVPNS